MGEDASNGSLGERLNVNVSENIPQRWLVQKFGGTSVGKVPEDIVNKVIRPYRLDRKVAIVCSARSSSSKAQGTTNRLLRAADHAPAQSTNEFYVLVNDVRNDHHHAAQKHIKSATILERLTEEIEGECQQALRVLAAAQTLGEVSPRSLDKVVGVGEKLSCRFMAAMLEDQGVPSKYVDLSEAIDFPTKKDLDQSFYNDVAQKFGDLISSLQDQVPVITGFFGQVPGSLLDRIGRGYTDLCAALVAVGLQAEELQVWKEVDGVFTTDPRKVPTACLLPSIRPVEAAELTFYGSEVIHPLTMEQAIRANIPIRIRNVLNPRGEGTLICPEKGNAQERASPGHDPQLFRIRSSSQFGKGEVPKRPTAVTVKHNILVLNIHSNRKTLIHGFFANIFLILNKWRLPIDLISTSEVQISMALHSEAPLYDMVDEDQCKITDADLQGAIEELQAYGHVDVMPQQAILSLVGRQLHHMPGIAGKMFSALGDNDVNIRLISQGASEVNISCVINERDADRAISVLHTNLFTFLDA